MTSGFPSSAGHTPLQYVVLFFVSDTWPSPLRMLGGFRCSATDVSETLLKFACYNNTDTTSHTQLILGEDRQLQFQSVGNKYPGFERTLRED